MPTGVKPDIPIGTAKVVTTGSYGPTTWANVFYMAIGSFDPAHLEDVIQLCSDVIGDLYNIVFTFGNFPAAWHFDTTRVLFHDAAGSHYKSARVISAVGSGGAGQDAQVAYLLNWVTNDPRRGGKPRTYIPGVVDGLMADTAALSGAMVSGVTTRLATWIAASATRAEGTASDVELLEMSFVDGGAYRADAHTWPIRAGSLNRYVATQRRRIDRLRS